jgi:hypothetical protein
VRADFGTRIAKSLLHMGFNSYLLKALSVKGRLQKARDFQILA